MKHANIQDKKVLLRVGFDVPIENGKISDDHRIINGLPTIKYLLEKNCEITVVNHIGRPNGKTDFSLSNKIVAEKIRELIAGYSSKHIHQPIPRIKVLENIRFDKREEEGSDELAKELAKGQDIFVQDAFSNCHRNHTSMVNITRFLPSYAGLLVEKEYSNLSKLIDNPVKPFVVIIGGAKVETKIPVIENLKKTAEYILVGGATANEAKEQGLFANDENIILPIDGVKDENNINRDIGVKTVTIYKDKLSTAKTIFWNGNLGVTENEKYQYGSREIAEYMANLSAYKVVGGGDSVKFINQLNLADKFDFISTGGGASLEFLSGKELPGLTPLII